MAAVRFEQVSKTYPNGHLAVKELDLEIRDGEFMVLVGPSGCGKSTALRMIAGLEMPTAGRIVIGERDVTGLMPQERDVAMVFQSYALYPHMTVRENLAFGLRMRHAARDLIARRVNEAAEALGLEAVLDRKPAQLSGGQRQRVALGRAIVREPQVFLFDEPLSNLDAALRVNTRIEIARLHRELSATMIYVTHDQVEAMTLADRIVVLNAGRIEQVGAPMELYNDPANVFVAGFIGSPQMNFLEAGPLGAPGKSIGVRPEHLAIDRSSGAIPGTISHVEHLGGETNVYVRTDQHGLLTVRRFGEHDYAVDETVHLTPEPSRTFSFGEDGRRLTV
jgi:multiple sugar transport system ATP-binding protein